jgi:hypothetical protein
MASCAFCLIVNSLWPNLYSQQFFEIHLVIKCIIALGCGLTIPTFKFLN